MQPREWEARGAMGTKAFRAVAVIVFAGCGHRSVVEQPAPQLPVEDHAAVAAPGAEADSLARVRAEREQVAREKAEQAVIALRAELVRMVHFDFDRADIRPEDATVLSRKAAILTANPSVRIRIAGNCDERGSDEYNLALGNRRAAAGKRFLSDHGVAADRMEVVSYGKERPLDPGHDETAWAANRRDEFEITGGGETLAAPVALR